MRLHEEATIGGLDFTAHAVVVQLSKQRCWITHGGYPKGFSCRDKADFAAANPERDTSDYGATVINREGMCWPCVAKDALSRETLE